jgi:hypothetical protein
VPAGIALPPDPLGREEVSAMGAARYIVAVAFGAARLRAVLPGDFFLARAVDSILLRVSHGMVLARRYRMRFDWLPMRSARPWRRAL